MNGHPGHTASGADSDNGSGPSYDNDRGRQGTTRRRASTRTSGGGIQVTVDPPSLAFDAMSLLRPASKRWYWVVLGGFAGVALGAVLGWWMWKPGYTVGSQIIAYESQVGLADYRPQKITGHTLVGMIQSPELFTKLGAKMKPPVHWSQIDARITVMPERMSDIVNIAVSGANPQDAVDLANRYNEEVITFMREFQRQEAEQTAVSVAEELKKAAEDVEEAKKSLPASAAKTLGEELPPAVIANQVGQQIQAAQAELEKLLIPYTDNHPLVRSKRAEIARLQTQVPAHVAADPRFTAERAPSVRPVAEGTNVSRDEMEVAFYHLRMREQLYNNLLNRHQGLQVFKTAPPGNFKVLQAPTLEHVAVSSPKLKVLLLAGFFGMLGMVAAATELLRREFFDNRLKTESDVKRVTGLPVLATVGDLRQMSLSGREDWAFRTWISLQDRLAYSPNHGLICGITSSNSGDGRSTWINLLACAARKCGFRVLTIATRSTTDPIANEETTQSTAEEPAEPYVVGATGEATDANGNFAHAGAGAGGQAREATVTREGPAPRSGTVTREPNASEVTKFTMPNRGFGGESEFTSLTASALFTPAMVTEKLTGPETDPLVHIPLPGWTWNLERRKQWQGALNVWRKIDNVVILVELPPASMPESVLLASNLPNLVWLVESGKSEATSTRAQLETLRHARCNLVGAFINRALTPMTEGRFSRWVGCLALFSLLSLFSPDLLAGDAIPATAAPMDVPAQFSIVSPSQRAAWQQKLTLGPGDVVTISLYGEPLLVAEEVPIGPDGRISYLEAQNVMAAGLTVDEFRARLNEELGKFRRAPQAFVVPVAYNSKKYYVLGKVTQSGVFTLDRPLTLIEAVARARGMETGVGPDNSLVELADLSRSFIARDGRHLTVDFEKLFQQGDLTQNIALEPNDYIYFPAAAQNQVYVLGEVRNPGTYIYTSSIGTLAAISARGGFTERAWKGRFLVVRGSLGRPETFEVDAKEILTGRKPDVKLQPKDIVFVSHRPWIRAEEILDAAASAFVTSAVVVWTGLHVNPSPTVTTPR